MRLSLDSTQPILVFGGPYSNLRAVEALRGEAERLGIAPSQTICTGDVVAYCAEAEETTRALIDWGCHVIAGNCEQQLASGAGDCGCNFEEGSACDLLAKGWYPYAAVRVSEASRRWMSDLLETLRIDWGGLRIRVVHGGCKQVNRWVFASETAVIAEECEASAADLVLAGHCGVPFVAHAGGTTWFNAGVVGMPANDGTAEVWYGLLRPDASGVHLSTHRLAYDHRAAAAAMRKSGHANGYARTLITGLWPSLDVLPAAERAMTGRPVMPINLQLDRAGGRQVERV